MFADLTFNISFSDCERKSIANNILFLQVNRFPLVELWFLLYGDVYSKYTIQYKN